jgi:Protein of unknown function (DUF3866)
LCEYLAAYCHGFARRRVTRRYPATVIKWRRGVVTAIRREWAGAVELTVLLRGDDPPEPPAAALARGDDPSEPPAATVRALAYPRLTGRPEPGDEVLLNTGALELGLGTGGYALVIAIPDRLPPDQPGPGHLVKARYTPMQAIVAGADEQGSAHHDALRDADDIEGIPVVIADLHSALPAVLAGFFSQWPASTGPGADTGCQSHASPRSADTGDRPSELPRLAGTGPTPRNPS